MPSFASGTDNAREAILDILILSRSEVVRFIISHLIMLPNCDAKENKQAYLAPERPRKFLVFQVFRLKIERNHFLLETPSSVFTRRNERASARSHVIAVRRVF